MGFVHLRQRIFRFGANFLGNRGYLGFCHILLGQKKIVNHGHAENEIRNGSVQIFKHGSDLDVGERRRPVCGHAQA